MANYRWKCPSVWLEQKIECADDGEALHAILKALLSKMDEDTIQDLFQDQMDEDGYFEPEND